MHLVGFIVRPDKAAIFSRLKNIERWSPFIVLAAHLTVIPFPFITRYKSGIKAKILLSFRIRWQVRWAVDLKILRTEGHEHTTASHRRVFEPTKNWVESRTLHSRRLNDRHYTGTVVRSIKSKKCVADHDHVFLLFFLP